MSIQGKVAQILNERDLVINKGANHGVTDGMLFQVTQPDVPINDPDSGAELGVLARDKIKVKVFEVYPLFSLAKTYETYRTSVLPPAEVALEMMRRTVTRTRKIIIPDPLHKSVIIDAEGSTVNIGDPVVQISE